CCNAPKFVAGERRDFSLRALAHRRNDQAAQPISIAHQGARHYLNGTHSPPSDIGGARANWPSEARVMALRDVKLDDKYDLGRRRGFATGFQALVRLCLMQKELDRRAGRNTAGFVSGYRGSPLAGLDQQFIRARRQLETSDVRFQGGLNEDLAATAIW